jgi:hypothetical protein
MLYVGEERERSQASLFFNFLLRPLHIKQITRLLPSNQMANIIPMTRPDLRSAQLSDNSVPLLFLHLSRF